jgi:GTP-binding protein
VKNELKNYSPDLLKKKELIVLNKIDLVDDELASEIIETFSKKINEEVLTLSTLEKKSVSKIKAKLISYVS